MMRNGGSRGGRGGRGGRVRRGGRRGGAGSRLRGRQGHSPAATLKLKICYDGQEWPLNEKSLKLGRAPTADIRISDPLVSNYHCVISNCWVCDQGSTNGTIHNDKELRPKVRQRLRANDELKIGDAVLTVEEGEVSKDELSRSKKFLGGESADLAAFVREEKRRKARLAAAERGDDQDGDDLVDNMGDLDVKDSDAKEDKDDEKTTHQVMEEEFSKIIGHDNIKTQLRQFHKKVQLDHIRKKNGKVTDSKSLYHMMFLGPPGTGKTTMANVVAKVMLKMKLVKSDKVVFVNNALDLLAGYSGQTAPKVDAKVAEAKGGVLFIDEAYSIVKEKHQKDSFGKEAIETIMKHMDPPSCVFIFAGYEAQMEEFLKVNDGLNRRIPYRYVFEAYDEHQLIDILKVMCTSKGETVEDDDFERIKELLLTISEEQRQVQNAGMIANWLSFAQIERDDRIDIEEAMLNPDLASILTGDDFEMGLEKLKLSG